MVFCEHGFVTWARQSCELSGASPPQRIEPLVQIPFCLIQLSPFKSCFPCECVVLFLCSMVGVSQMHYTSAVVCCQAGWCLRRMRYSQTQGTPCSELGDAQLLLEEEKGQPLSCYQKEHSLGLGRSCKGLGAGGSHQHLASGYPFPRS